MGLLLGLAALAAATLTIGLLRPWGRVFPRWMPRLGGRDVPVLFPTLTAGLIGAVMAVAGRSMVQSFVARSADGEDAHTAYLFLIPLPLWGPALMLAAWGYYLHARGACAACGAGDGDAAGQSLPASTARTRRVRPRRPVPRRARRPRSPGRRTRRPPAAPASRRAPTARRRPSASAGTRRGSGPGGRRSAPRSRWPAASLRAYGDRRLQLDRGTRLSRSPASMRPSTIASSRWRSRMVSSSSLSATSQTETPKPSCVQARAARTGTLLQREHGGGVGEQPDPVAGDDGHPRPVGCRAGVDHGDGTRSARTRSGSSISVASSAGTGSSASAAAASAYERPDQARPATGPRLLRGGARVGLGEGGQQLELLAVGHLVGDQLDRRRVVGVAGGGGLGQEQVPAHQPGDQVDLAAVEADPLRDLAGDRRRRPRSARSAGPCRCRAAARPPSARRGEPPGGSASRPRCRSPRGAGRR